MSSSPHTPAVERTLLVLFAPENTLGAPHARRTLGEAGLAIAAQTDASGEELEEAGIDLGLSVGEEAQGEPDNLSHTVWVLEREGAIALTKDIRARALAEECPNLRTFAAPSASAADMAIEALFPSLPSLCVEKSIIAFPTDTDGATKPKPFALSNLAFSAAQDATPSKPSTRQLSPSIEKALVELEQREQNERLRKASRSSRGSTASPSALRGTSPTDAKALPPPQTSSSAARRVFTTTNDQASQDVGDTDQDAALESLEQANGHVAAGEAIEPVDSATSRPSSPLRGPSPRPRPRSVASVASVNSCASSFRARPAPTREPSIQPRLTKAAALRLGIALPPSTPRRSTAGVSASTDLPSQHVPVVPAPRSLAKPAITPRMSKTALLRTAKDHLEPHGTRDSARELSESRPTAVKKRQSMSTAERAAMDRLARWHSMATASASAVGTPGKAPEVRMSRAALLRQGLPPVPVSTPSLPPSSATTTRTSARRASVSADLKALREPERAPRMTKAASLRDSLRPSVPVHSGSPAAMAALPVATAPPTKTLISSKARSAASAPSSGLSSAATPTRRRTFTAAPPVVTPRLNKAAELRRAKLGTATQNGIGSVPIGVKGSRAPRTAPA